MHFSSQVATGCNKKIEVISAFQAKINNYYWICSYWEVILLITYLLTTWMLNQFCSVCRCMLHISKSCLLEHTCSYEAIHKYWIFFKKCILITWLKIFAHESNFPLELSYVALRRNSVKGNSGAVLSGFVCFCCNLLLSYGIIIKAGVLIYVITSLHIACVPRGDASQIAIFEIWASLDTFYLTEQ